MNQLSPPIDWDFFPTLAQIWASKSMANKVICAKMTEYKVVQNVGISQTKGACVTLEVFYTEMYKNQCAVIDGSFQSYQYNQYEPSLPETNMGDDLNGS